MLKKQLYITANVFEDLKEGDFIYWYDRINNIIHCDKIIKTIINVTAHKQKVEIIELVSSYNIKYSLTINSLIFLTERECFLYFMNNYKEKLKNNYAEKYPEYYI